jgi:hypothetical protein
VSLVAADGAEALAAWVPAPLFSAAAQASVSSIPDGVVAPAPPPAGDVGPTRVGSGFIVRRVPNPAYRPPSTAAPLLGVARQSRLRALDFGRFQVSRRGSGAFASRSEWDMSAGEEAPIGDRFAVAATGSSDQDRSLLRTLRLETRLSSTTAELGDVNPVTLVASDRAITGLRGLSLDAKGAANQRWLLALGGPTPLIGMRTDRIRFGALGVREWRVNESTLSAAAVGFGRGARAAIPPGISGGAALATSDTVAGRGGTLTVGGRTPLGRGTFDCAFAGQLHDLDGPGVLALSQSLGWRFTSPSLVAELRDQRVTPGFRTVAADRITTEAGSDTRWNVQSRHAGGRLEWHMAGAWRSGGDPLLAARTVQLGSSMTFGRSAWNGGAETVWDDRAGIGEHRLSAQISRFAATTPSFTARWERTARTTGAARSILGGEVLMPLQNGLRATVEPGLGWDGNVFDRALLTTRLVYPLTWASGRLTYTFAAAAEREREFRPRLDEVAVAFAWVPRPRDRANLEVRRLDEGAGSSMEMTGSYDLAVERFMSTSSASRIDTGLVRVHVGRAGNGAGLGDVLVSLDGREFRFTDADGMATFERVAPGVHVLSIDEASLPRNDQVVGIARVFVTVEQGRPVPPVSFTIARPERRQSF